MVLKSCSTSTSSAKLQSIISRALDDEEHVILSSFDLSSAFDLVNFDLHVTRLKILGLTKDFTNLISISMLLRNSSFCVSINGINSILYELLLGTVQGSFLGLILYVNFVSPLLHIVDLTAFADDTFIT
jgi:hypothetical protein